MDVAPFILSTNMMLQGYNALGRAVTSLGMDTQGPLQIDLAVGKYPPTQHHLQLLTTCSVRLSGRCQNGFG